MFSGFRKFEEWLLRKVTIFKKSVLENGDHTLGPDLRYIERFSFVHDISRRIVLILMKLARTVCRYQKKNSTVFASHWSSGTRLRIGVLRKGFCVFIRIATILNEMVNDNKRNIPLSFRTTGTHGALGSQKKSLSSSFEQFLNDLGYIIGLILMELGKVMMYSYK
jgi:hypothetical protein